MFKVFMWSQCGIRVMVYLARKKNKICPLKEISKKEELSFDYLEKIISKLKKSGLIKVHCLVLAAVALPGAIYDYLRKNKKEIPKELEIRHQKIKKEKEIIDKKYKKWIKLEEKMYKK